MELSRPERANRLDFLLAGIAAFLTFGELYRLRSILRFWNPDLIDYAAWDRYLVLHGRLRSIHGLFSSYNPPYLYALAVMSNLQPRLDALLVVRLANLPFMLLSAAVTFWICERLGGSRRRAWLAAWIMMVAPEIIANAFVWGQSDSMETAFLLLAAALLLGRRPYWAMFAAGVSISFKLQAVFLGPALVALLLTGALPWTSLPLLAAGYLAMMVPAELAGRPLWGVTAAYSGQVATPEKIAMGAANPYEFLLPWTGRIGYGPRVWWAEHVGLGVGAVAMAWLVWFLVRSRPLDSGRRLLAALSLSAFTAPFVLPKMHERYFYIGDTLLLVLGLVDSRFLLPAGLAQIAAVLVYAPYLIGFRPSPWWYLLPTLIVLLVLWTLIRSLRERSSELQEDTPFQASGQPLASVRG